MGKEIVVNSLEEMCDLMCNNKLPEEYKTCKRCGRKLKNPKAKELGYGAVCWNKRQTNQRTTLF